MSLYNELFPKICALRDTSDDPIYVYIDSRGGIVHIAEKLHELMKAPRHDGSVCTVVSIVPQLAGSAAADLAILGDFSTVYPSGLIHCHGTRISANELTVDNLGLFDETLRSENENHAIKLASKVIKRLAFLIWLKKDDIDDFDLDSLPNDDQEPDLIPDAPRVVKYFLSIIKNKRGDSPLSPAGNTFITRCLQRWDRKSQIISILTPDPKTPDKSEKMVAKELLTKVLADINDHSSVTEISRKMLNDAILLDELFSQPSDDLNDLVSQLGRFFLSSGELKEFIETADQKQDDFLNKKVRMEVLLTSLFVKNLCQTLHENENPFRAIDAYHIGLVDEIYGMTHIFPSMRSLEAEEAVATEND